MASPQQTPDFILDLGTNLAAAPLPWTIRRWSDAEAEVTKAGGYGIISYAWGKWHDKSQYALGGTKGNVNPNGYPTFDIGVSTKESTNGADMYIAGKTEQFIGPTTGRKIPKGTPYSWIFPKVCPVDAGNNIIDKTQEVFTIRQIQTALKNMGMRFIWWDWACIPQGWAWDWRPYQQTIQGTQTRGVERGPNFQTHDELKAAAASSMNKMRYFYPASTTGCLWWHETTWNRGANPGNVERIVDLMNAVNSMKQLTSAELISLVNYLTNATRTESSLLSLWSFQEAVLFTSTARPHQAGRISADQGHGSPSVVLDNSGAPYVIATQNDPTKLFFQHGQLNLEDISNLVTILAHVIGGCLLRYGATSDSKNLSNLENWCLDATNETTARGLLSQLINTGFAGLRFDSPLLLLEARFGREIRPDQSAIDVSVYTVMGAVSVDLSAQQKIAADIVSKELGATPDRVKAEKLTLDVMKRAFLVGLFELYQWRMLLFARRPAALVAPAGPAAPPAQIPTIWEALVGTTRPKTAALTPYIDPDSPLAQSFGPNAIQGGKHPDVVDKLPKLLLNSEVQPLLSCNLLGDYAIYDYATGGPAGPAFRGWAQCVFYSYVETTLAWLPAVAMPPAAAAPPGGAAAPAPPAIVPAGTVRAVNVPFVEREGQLGHDVVLFPFQTAVEQPPLVVADVASKAKTWTRCFVMVRNGANADAMTFRGVGDFFGIDDASIKPKKSITIA